MPSRLKVGPRPYLARRFEELEAVHFDSFKVRRLGVSLGAEIEGVQIGRVDDATMEDIRRALIEFKVVFFRDQQLTVAEHKRFAEHFGEIEDHPFLPAKDGHEDVIRFEKSQDVAGYENQWHSDVSWREVPSLGAVLRAVEVPEVGGDTLFADMVAAYEGLSDKMKERIDGLVCVHDFMNSFGVLLSDEEREKRRVEYPPARHPLVRTRPETGEKCLYVNAIFTSHIEGMDAQESEALLSELVTEASHPEYQVRFHWRNDSVAFWDNRVTQHYASNDYWPRRRVMERVTIIGERPE
jgi:taurine dioxygenase